MRVFPEKESRLSFESDMAGSLGYKKSLPWCEQVACHLVSLPLEMFIISALKHHHCYFLTRPQSLKRH
jgi:hypothetical protein